jgi:hypothetical protein
MTNWSYIDSKDLPVLALCTKQDDLNFKPEYNFKPYEHISSGYTCSTHKLFIKILNPTPNAQKLIEFLNKEYYHSCFIEEHVPLDEIIKYQLHLKLFDLDCVGSYINFQEAMYPIDCEYIHKLTTDDLPENLDDMVNWEKPINQMCGMVGRWKLYVLTENSD